MGRRKHRRILLHPLTGSSLSYTTYKTARDIKRDDREASDLAGIRLLMLLLFAAIGCASVIWAGLIP